MGGLKLKLNNFLLKRTGYVFTKLDQSGRTFRDDLYQLVQKRYGHAIHGNILDIGSKYGSWAKNTFGKTHQVTTLDKRGDADIQGDLLHLPFADNTFDCVFCFETIEHVENPFQAVAELRRVLKKGGILIGSTPFHHELHGEEYGDYWRITRQGWRHLLSGFIDVEVKEFGRNELLPHHYLFKAVK